MPSTEAGKRLLADLDTQLEFRSQRADAREAIAAIEAEAVAAEDERITGELRWRDEEDWRKAIVNWLGPQRMSIERPRAEREYAKGAVMAAAILLAIVTREDTDATDK